MDVGKSIYSFTIDPAKAAQVNSVIEDWLRKYNFSLQNKLGEDMYYSVDPLYGNMGFQYSISGGSVSIAAFIVSRKKFFKIDDISTSMAARSYKTIISELLNSINSTVGETGQVQNQAQGNGTGSLSGLAEAMQKDVVTKNEKYAEAAFWISLAGLVLSFFGISYGIILYILIFCFAIPGLKTRKKTKAILAMVFSGLSFLITILLIFVPLN
ncbi:MAG: hypothetical protein ACOX6J_04330 [Oscillospiraceae bacterium]|jgi:hypothetical protein